MYPSKHLIFGLIFSLVLYLVFQEIGIPGFLTIWLASFLIDVDHYLYYAISKKDISLQISLSTTTFLAAFIIFLNIFLEGCLSLFSIIEI